MTLHLEISSLLKRAFITGFKHAAPAIIAYTICCGSSFSAEHQNVKISVSYQKGNGKILLLLQNDTNEDVRLNRSFSLSPLLGSLHIVATEKGVVRPLLAQTDPSLPARDDYVLLSPGEIFGKALDTQMIFAFYGITGACFELNAYYKDPNSSAFSAFKGEITSGTVKICR